MISSSFKSGGLSGLLPADVLCLLSARTTSLPSERLSTIQNLQTGIAVIALLGGVLLAPSTLPAKENSGTVRGFVYDSATGTPLPQVQVEMTGEVTVAATTTIEGRFTIEGLPGGSYTVSYASASHHAVSVEELQVIAGATADASTGMLMRVKSTELVPVSALDPRFRRSALNSKGSESRASADSALGVGASIDVQSSNPRATDERGIQNRTGSALMSRGSARINRNGLRFESRGGALTSEMHLRSQIRFSSPIAGIPRQPEHFLRANENDLRFRRARFKTSGQIFRPWIRYNTEYDLVGTRMLDLRVTVQKWEWLQFRFGQWKTEFGRERVSSSGRQEFVERSIVNRQFTADRQKGFMVLGRVKNGTRADSQYYAGVFTGNGRGFRSSGAGSLDNRDGAPMWVARYQWNFLKDDPGFSQSDLEYHKAPVAAIAIAGLSNRSRFTRFSGSGGGSLDGFEVGLPGQFAVRQVAEDFVLKYRGLFLQHEFHWKKIRDRIYHRITSMSGATFQGGYFPHRVAHWVPEQLELGLRYATVDQDHGRQYDRITESAFVVNWFMEGHSNKLTFDVGRYGLVQANGTGRSVVQVRMQWDVTF